jgi:citrate lyase subunit beta / citryl-CoA lyase
MTFRSLLFVPGTRPDRFDKAIATGASYAVIDLEDAVAPADKEQARDLVGSWLTAAHNVILRINGADTRWFADDLELCKRDGVAGVMLPKAENIESLAAVLRAGAGFLLPLIESAAGFAALGSIAAAPGVACVAFGSIDFQVDLGMRDATEDDLLPFRSQLALASRIAGIGPPIDGVSTVFDNEDALRADVLRARRLGFGGKLCIHPRQVAAVNTLFAPTVEEMSWARRVLDAASAAGGGAIAVDGKMVDKPVLLRAEAIIRESTD